MKAATCHAHLVRVPKGGRCRECLREANKGIRDIEQGVAAARFWAEQILQGYAA